MRRREFLKGIFLGAAAAVSPAEVFSQENGAIVKEFHVKLSRYKYTPSMIRVNQGDRVRLVLEGMDLEHGFYIDGYDLEAKVRHADVKVLEFLADKAGSFKIRCSVVCGPFHPFMTGKLVVEPNQSFLVSSALSLATPFAALILIHLLDRRRRNGN